MSALFLFFVHSVLQDFLAVIFLSKLFYWMRRVERTHQIIVAGTCICLDLQVTDENYMSVSFWRWQTICTNKAFTYWQECVPTTDVIVLYEVVCELTYNIRSLRSRHARSEKNCVVIRRPWTFSAVFISADGVLCRLPVYCHYLAPLQSRQVAGVA